MQCNDIDGINASGRAPIIMQQASVAAAIAAVTQVSIGDNVIGLALGKASSRLGTW